MTHREYLTLTFLGDEILLGMSQSPVSLVLDHVPYDFLPAPCGADPDVDSVLVSELASHGMHPPKQATRLAAGVPFGVAHSPAFADYQDPGTLERDVLFSSECVEEEPPPSSVAKVPKEAWSKVEQAGFNCADPITRAALDLTSKIFKNRAHGNFHGYSCVRRCYPSNGARHGFEAAVEINFAGRPCTAFYSPEEDTFWSTEPLPGERPDEITIVVYVHWDRYFWRYRNAWYYNTVLLEAGHMLGSIRILADEIGFNARVTPAFGFHPCDPWWSPFLSIRLVDSEPRH